MERQLRGLIQSLVILYYIVCIYNFRQYITFENEAQMQLENNVSMHCKRRRRIASHQISEAPHLLITPSLSLSFFPRNWATSKSVAAGCFSSPEANNVIFSPCNETFTRGTSPKNMNFIHPERDFYRGPPRNVIGLFWVSFFLFKEQ